MLEQSGPFRVTLSIIFGFHKEVFLSRKLSELASLVGAQLVGEDLEVQGVNALLLASEEELSFVESRRHLEAAQNSKAKALLVPPSLVEELPGKSLLVVENVRAALAQLAWLFYQSPPPPKGISPLAFVAEGAKVHPEASIYPFVYVGEGAQIGAGSVLYPFVYVGEGCEIGKDCLLYPHVVLYPRTKLADRVILHAGAVVGSDGFGYAQEGERHLKIPHFGRAELEEEVEIGANTCIDRATFGVTRIGAGSKIDNLVQIAHNVVLGRGCVLAGQVGLTGSVEVGDFVMVGGQAGINQRVGERALIAAKAGVAREVPPRTAVAGAPAMEIQRWRRCVAVYEKLPELWKELRELRNKVAQLEEALNERNRP